jgi:hypothetical protein
MARLNKYSERRMERGRNKIKLLRKHMIFILNYQYKLTLVEDKVFPLGCILSASAATSLISLPAASLSFT